MPTSPSPATGRGRVLAALGAAPDPATTRALAERTGMHRNGVRAQLLKLRGDGLVEAIRVARGPGRPRDEWSLTPDGRAALADVGSTADLARWLAEIIAGRPDLLGDVEAAGERIGRTLAAEASAAGAEERLLESLHRLGFAPRLDAAGPPETVIRLRHCPYRDAAAVAGEVVCLLHRGITAGVVAADGAARLSGFEPHDPFAAGCEIRVHSR